MKLDETTLVYMGITELLDKIAKAVRDPYKLPAWQVEPTPAEQRRLEMEERIKQLAREQVYDGL